MLLQIIMIMFAMFAWSRAILRLRDKDITLGEFFFWSFIWIGVIVLALFPKIMDLISSLLGTGYINVILYSSIILLFYLIFRIYVSIDAHNREITKLVREIAVKEAKKKKK